MSSLSGSVRVEISSTDESCDWDAMDRVADDAGRARGLGSVDVSVSRMSSALLLSLSLVLSMSIAVSIPVVGPVVVISCACGEENGREENRRAPRGSPPLSSNSARWCGSGSHLIGSGSWFFSEIPFFRTDRLNDDGTRTKNQMVLF